MSPFIAEIIGTAILVIFGNGVVANVVLNKTKGHQGGWIVITWGWAIGVFAGVFTVAQFSGAHINPAVTVGLATAGLFQWSLVIPYIIAQTIGGAVGSFLVWVSYKDHFAATEDKALILACHSTSPNIRNYPSNFMTEVVGTFILVFGVLYLVAPGFMSADGHFLEVIVINGQEVGFGLGALSALPVALLVLGLGLSLGGPTGYAINPARDLGPRIMHTLLPIPTKGGSDWAYSWIPVIAPLTGAVLAAGLFLILG